MAERKPVQYETQTEWVFNVTLTHEELRDLIRSQSIDIPIVVDSLLPMGICLIRVSGPPPSDS